MCPAKLTWAWSHGMLFAMKFSVLLRSAFFGTALFAGAAAADIPPEPGYVETCTIANECKANEIGETCGAWHGDRDACKTRFAKTAWSYRCSTRGASTWTEVWCAPKGTPNPLSGPKPAPEKPTAPPPPPPG